MYAFTRLFTHLRVGEGAAASFVVFALSAVLAACFVHLISREEAR
jgi:ABC-type sugar transport system permease subunit